MSTITIEHDDSCDMITITAPNGKCLFDGNTWDFDRSVSTFKQMFKDLGFNVTTKEIDYERT